MVTFIMTMSTMCIVWGLTLIVLAGWMGWMSWKDKKKFVNAPDIYLIVSVFVIGLLFFGGSFKLWSYGMTLC